MALVAITHFVVSFSNADQAFKNFWVVSTYFRDTLNNGGLQAAQHFFASASLTVYLGSNPLTSTTVAANTALEIGFWVEIRDWVRAGWQGNQRDQYTNVRGSMLGEHILHNSRTSWFWPPSPVVLANFTNQW
jgi:hypothetical protein